MARAITESQTLISFRFASLLSLQNTNETPYLCRSLVIQSTKRLLVTSTVLALPSPRRTTRLLQRHILLRNAPRVLDGTGLDVELARSSNHCRAKLASTLLSHMLLVFTDGHNLPTQRAGRTKGGKEQGREKKEEEKTYSPGPP